MRETWRIQKRRRITRRAKEFVIKEVKRRGKNEKIQKVRQKKGDRWQTIIFKRMNEEKNRKKHKWKECRCKHRDKLK